MTEFGAGLSKIKENLPPHEKVAKAKFKEAYGDIYGSEDESKTEAAYREFEKLPDFVHLNAHMVILSVLMLGSSEAAFQPLKDPRWNISLPESKPTVARIFREIDIRKNSLPKMDPSNELSSEERASLLLQYKSQILRYITFVKEFY